MAAAVGLTGVTVLAIAAAVELWRICGAGRGLPLWDLADHGLAGVELAGALRHGDLAGFLLGINRQVLWPFVHSLMLAPWLLALGSDYATTDRLSSVLFAATIVTLYATGLRLHAARGACVACAAATLALLAPLYRVFGTLCMLEMPGAFLLALTACLHVHACRESPSRALLMAAGLSSSALFLCKYNYGLLWLVPLAIHEWTALAAPRRAALLVRGATFVRSRRWLRPFPLFMLAYLVAILAILVTGGGVLERWGARISVRSAGNPAYGFYVIASLWAVALVRRAGGFGAVSRRLSSRHRILIATVVLPLAIWLLIPYPNRIRALVGFVVNRDSGQPLLSLETLLHYPRAFAHDYSPTPAVGWITLALALIPPWRRHAGRDPGLLICLALWVGLLATAVHHYQQPRFLFTTALLVWLRAAESAIGLLDEAICRLGLPAWVRSPVWTAGLASLVAWAAIGAPPADATLAAHRTYYSAATLGPVLDRVLEHAGRADERPWLLGYSNILSPALLRWHGRLTRPALAAGRVPENPPALAPDATEEAIAGRIEMLRGSGRPVIAALAMHRFPGDGEYRAETRPDSTTAARLGADGRVRTESDDVLGSSGFWIATFRFQAPRRAPIRPR